MIFRTAKYIRLIPVAALFFFFSCSHEEVVQKQYDYQKADSLPPDYLLELGNIRVSIEQMASLNELFLEKKYSYNSAVLHSANKASNYSISKVQAMNLGVYSADLNYIVAFQQSQDVRNYMDVVMQLAQKLGLQSAFNKELIEKLTSSDTTLNKPALLTRAFRQAEDNLFSQERAHLATLMVAGGWVEALYIATSVLKSKPVDEDMRLLIFDNAYTYNNVKKMLKVFQEECKDCKDILIEFDMLNAPIEDIIYNSRHGITQAQLERLHAPLSELRNKMVG